jgi:cellulose synthase/poly-beta-1,6-N-acetylglucosamine synthase-like glycosyltransferase
MLLGIVCLLFFLVVAGYCLLILFYRKGWLLLHEFILSKTFIPKTAVTIIIPARNEEANIEKVIGCLLSQQYPQHLIELIVVDDHSTDNTAALVSKYPSVKLISLANELQQTVTHAYKKKAIEHAISQSSGDFIITTDADCVMCERWLQSIIQYYETYKYQCIAAPVAFTTTSNWFSVFQSIDFMTMQGITAAVLHTNSGSMCNGANFGYTRKAFEAVNGFKDINHIASGDDMMLMNKINKQFPNSCKYLKCKDAIVYTAPMPTIKDFLNQRIRWASKAPHLNDTAIKLVLGLVYSLNVLFPLLLLLSFFYYKFFVVAFIYLGLKIVVEYFFLYPVSSFFLKKAELKWFIILQPLHIIYMIAAGFFGLFGTYTWKGRTTT